MLDGGYKDNFVPFVLIYSKAFSTIFSAFAELSVENTTT
jgi:hypothetical protein